MYGQLELCQTRNVIAGDPTLDDFSAKFQIESQTQGMLMPRMLKSQMHAIPEPTDGLMVFVTDANFSDRGFYFFDEKLLKWIKIPAFDCSSCENQFLTDTNNNGIFDMQLPYQCNVDCANSAEPNLVSITTNINELCGNTLEYSEYEVFVDGLSQGVFDIESDGSICFEDYDLSNSEISILIYSDCCCETLEFLAYPECPQCEINCANTDLVYDANSCTLLWNPLCDGSWFVSLQRFTENGWEGIIEASSPYPLNRDGMYRIYYWLADCEGISNIVDVSGCANCDCSVQINENNDACSVDLVVNGSDCENYTIDFIKFTSLDGTCSGDSCFVLDSLPPISQSVPVGEVCDSLIMGQADYKALLVPNMYSGCQDIESCFSFPQTVSKSFDIPFPIGDNMHVYLDYVILASCGGCSSTYGGMTWSPDCFGANDFCCVNESNTQVATLYNSTSCDVGGELIELSEIEELIENNMPICCSEDPGFNIEIFTSLIDRVTIIITSSRISEVQVQLVAETYDSDCEETIEFIFNSEEVTECCTDIPN